MYGTSCRVDPAKRRKQKVRSGFSTRKDAIAWFTRKAEELRQGIAPADDRQTVEQYLRQWLEAIADSVSGSALHAYSNHVEAHIIPAIGKIRVTELRPQHIEKAKARWATEPAGRRKKKVLLSSRTVHHVFSTLRTALYRAKRQRLIAVNPCELVDPPRVEQREMRALDAENAAKLLAACDRSVIGAAIATSLGTGLRRGELLARSAGRRRPRAGLAHSAARDRARRPELEIRKDPKTKRSRRTIGVPRFVVDRLRRHRTERAQWLWAKGLGRLNVDTLVFERAGEPWAPNTFGTAFMRALHDAGVPHMPAPRSPPHVRIDGARGRRRPQDRLERTRTLDHLDDCGHLRACYGLAHAGRRRSH